jgi:hypothetical protein
MFRTLTSTSQLTMKLSAASVGMTLFGTCWVVCATDECNGKGRGVSRFFRHEPGSSYPTVMGKIVRKTLDEVRKKPISEERKREVAALAKRPDSEIDQSDIPELTKKFWQNALPESVLQQGVSQAASASGREKLRSMGMSTDATEPLRLFLTQQLKDVEADIETISSYISWNPPDTSGELLKLRELQRKYREIAASIRNEIDKLG